MLSARLLIATEHKAAMITGAVSREFAFLSLGQRAIEATAE